LPLIHAVNPQAADVIAGRFDLNGGKPDDRSAAARTVAAFQSALESLGVPCQDVGSSDTVDVCSGTLSAASKAGISLGVIIGFALLCCGALWWWRRRRAKTAEQESLIFKDPKGELNHTSELYPSGRRDSYEEKKEEIPGPGESTESSQDDEDEATAEAGGDNDDDDRIQVV
jgi:hypothetical protein